MQSKTYHTVGIPVGQKYTRTIIETETK